MQVDLTIELADIIVYFIAVTYAVIVLTVADVTRRKLNKSPDFTRKIVHLFAGGAIWTVPFYPHPWVATFVALTFVVMLALANQARFARFFAAMARPEDLEHGSVRGPVWYAVSITILTGIFTFTGFVHLYFLAAAGIHIMMLGDGMSAPIGMKYGKNSSRKIFGSIRSLQGCLALFVFGFIGAFIAIWFFGIINYRVFVGSSDEILFIPWITIALTGSIAATLIELVSPKGTDNITVPFTSTVVMLITALLFGMI